MTKLLRMSYLTIVHQFVSETVSETMVRLSQTILDFAYDVRNFVASTMVRLFAIQSRAKHPHCVEWSRQTTARYLIKTTENHRTQWFEVCTGDDEMDDNALSHSHHAYHVSMTETSFRLAKFDETGGRVVNLDLTVCPSHTRFLNIILWGQNKTSLFNARYPNGIDITSFGNFCFQNYRVTQDSPLQLYELIPLILYHVEDEPFPYEKEDLCLTLLEDDTFEEYTLKSYDPLMLYQY
jgi:hypothetical protein